MFKTGNAVAKALPLHEKISGACLNVHATIAQKQPCRVRTHTSLCARELAQPAASTKPFVCGSDASRAQVTRETHACAI